MKKYILLSIATAAALTFAGCSDDNNDNDGAALASTISFSEVKVPETDAEKRSILASDTVTINGVDHSISYNTIIRSGDILNGNTYGLIYDKNGSPVIETDGSQMVSVSSDFASLLPIGNKLFMVSHFETRPAAMYITELDQDEATGKLTALNTKNIDFSAFNGLWVPCAGSVTPWNTHLGSEEYPPNAAAIDENGYIDSYYEPMANYVGGDLTALNPYDYGWVPEIEVLDENGNVKVQKHYTMGRFAHELSYVMPDKKTVYQSDDGTNGVFYKFVADTAGDLSAGTLYAAKWNQTSSVGGGTANITWVDLGHATNEEIKAALDAKYKFGDIFTVADRNTDNTCPTGFIPSNWAYKNECLKINDGMEKIASRLESGRYAGMMGATTEFSKMEGITYNPQNHEMYMAMSRTEKGMEDYKYDNQTEDKYDKGGPNHIRLQERNHCGVVYKMALDGYNITTMESLVEGEGMEADASGNTCRLDKISMPDNVTFIPNTDTLIIGEDTSYHQNDMIWAYNLTSKNLTRIQTTPYGSETTSPYYYPNINGFGYLTSVVQHPFGESDQDQLTNPDEAKAYTGYIGPFPVIK